MLRHVPEEDRGAGRLLHSLLNKVQTLKSSAAKAAEESRRLRSHAKIAVLRLCSVTQAHRAAVKYAPSRVPLRSC